MADDKKPPSVAELQAELATMKAEKAQAEAEIEKLRPAKPIPPLPKASGTFVSTLPHYRAGRLYTPGERINIKDESPGRTWTRVGEEDKKAAPVAPAAPSGRPSDRSLT
jgi:hypothetical protein